MYNTNPGIHTGITGHRLENFFWRVWGSEVLLATMSGSMFARLFRVIEEGEYAEGLKLRDLGDLGTVCFPPGFERVYLSLFYQTHFCPSLTTCLL